MNCPLKHAQLDGAPDMLRFEGWVRLERVHGGERLGRGRVDGGRCLSVLYRRACKQVIAAEANSPQEIFTDCVLIEHLWWLDIE
jgi:hypothetical protein